MGLILPGDAQANDVRAGKKYSAGPNYNAAGSLVDNGALGTITPSNVSQPIPAGITTGGNVAAVVVPVANVLTGTTIAGQAGTMVNNGAGGTVTPGTANQTRAAGFWSSLITILGDVALIAANIMTGKTIFGVAGTATADATAGAGDIASGKTAYVNGAKVTGSGTSAKPYISGSGTSSVGTLNFTNTGGTSPALNYVSVSGLNFPNGIAQITIYVGAQAVETFYNHNVFPTTANTNILASTSSSVYDTFRLTGNAFVNNTSFQLPIAAGSAAFTYEVWGL